MTRSRATVAGAVFAVLAVGVVGLSAWNPLHPEGSGAATGVAAGARTADRDEIQRVALRALVIQQNLGSEEPATWGIRGLPSQSAAQAQLHAAVSAKAVAPALRSQVWRGHVDEVFKGPGVRARMLRGIANTENANQDPDNRDLGGGVSAITFTQEVIGPDTSTVGASATVWAASAVRNSGQWLVSRPSSDINVEFRLAKDVSGKWMVTDMVSSFAQGSGP